MDYFKLSDLPHIPYILQQADWSSLHQTEEIKSKLETFRNGYRGFLVMSGSNGSGKSYAACALLAEYMKLGWPRSGVFKFFPQMVMEYNQLVRDPVEMQNFILKLQETELLVLDDFGLKDPTEGFLNFLMCILDARLHPHRGTILTTNLKDSQLRSVFGDAIRSRICSGLLVRIDNEDRRLNPLKRK